MSKTTVIVLVAVLVIGAGAFAGYHYFNQPPSAVRLLPDGDFFAYFNMKPAHFLQSATPQNLGPDYEEFRNDTGFDVQHDLDDIAVEVTKGLGPNDVKLAFVAEGRFNTDKVHSFLTKKGAQSENYHGQDISIVEQGHDTIRVCLLGKNALAISNDLTSMHEVIDHYAGSGNHAALIDEYYGQVPTASVFWLIGRIPADELAKAPMGGMDLSYLKGAVAIASVRYAGSVYVKAEVITQTEAGANTLVTQVNGGISIAKAMFAGNAKSSDPDVKTVVDSLKVEQSGKRAIVSLTVPEALIEKSMKEAQSHRGMMQ